MKIQSINSMTTNQNFKSKILRKIPQETKPKMDPVKEMNRNFTIAAIIIILIELGMATAAYFNKKQKHEQPQKVELSAPDATRAQQSTLWVE